LKQNLAPINLAVRRKQSQDGIRQSAFPAAGFPEDSEYFSGTKVERDFIEGAQAFAIRLGVGDAQTVNAQ